MSRLPRLFIAGETIKLCDVRSKVDYTRGPTQASEKSIEHVLYLESGDPSLVMPVTLPKRSSKNSSTNKTQISASLTESLVEDNLSSENVEIENDDVFDDEILLKNDNIQLDLQQSSSLLDNDGDERLGVLQISTDDLDAIRLILQGSKRLKTTLSSNLGVTDLLSDVNKLKKLTDNDLKEIMNYLNIKIQGMGKEMDVKGSKGKKLNELCLHLGIEVSDEQLEKRNSRPLKKPKTLRSLTQAKIKSFGKQFLEVVFAEYSWPTVEKDWREGTAVNETVGIQELNRSFTPAFTPEKVSIDGVTSPHIGCLDGHHIRTNVRAKICRTGTENLKREAWLHVAKQKTTPLSLAMLEPNKDGKILDQQSDKYVRTMFSGLVEKEQMRLGYQVEAEFTKLFREWHGAEDMPGIEAAERCRRALDLRDWLLQDMSFAQFPPDGNFVKGFPRITFEGLVCNIEAHIYMYALAKSGTYNWRSMSTLVSENLFGEISEMESHNNGVPSGRSFERNIVVIAGLHAVRFKPDRQFCMQTAKSRAYPIPKVDPVASRPPDNALCAIGHNTDKISCVNIRDHEFDKRTKGGSGSKKGTIKGPFEAPRGVKPVRYHYKVDESKMEWSNRMGIKLEDA